jgi:hypothetical protein
VVPALVATLAFAWFPRRTEAVAWLSCRPDLLAALFSVLSLATFDWWLRANPAEAGSHVPSIPHRRARRAWWLVASISAWWLALLSKEAALLVPLAHAALAWNRFRTMSLLLPFAFSWPAYLLWRRAVVGEWIGGYGVEAVAVRPGTATSALKHLAYQVVPPLGPLEPLVRLPLGGAAVAAAMVVLLLGVAWAAWRLREDAVVRVGMAWLLAGLLPVMTLPVSLTTTFNDRLLYLPAIGFVLLATGLLARMRPRTLIAGGTAVCLFFGAWSWMLSQRWARAWTMTSASVAALKDALEQESAPRVYLVAAPDSIGGAYMLRNGVREALASAGARGADRLLLLSWYFLEPDATSSAPVEAALESPTVVRLSSVGPAPQVIVGTPDATGRVEYDAPGTTDRLGRRQWARIRLREPGAVWLVAPGRVEFPGRSSTR